MPDDQSILENLEVSELQEFRDTRVWKAIQEYILAGIDQSQAILESATSMEEIRGAQGRIAELRSLYELPETQIEQIRDEKEEQKGE